MTVGIPQSRFAAEERAQVLNIDVFAEDSRAWDEVPARVVPCVAGTLIQAVGGADEAGDVNDVYPVGTVGRTTAGEV
jgi:hypothetical protein